MSFLKLLIYPYGDGQVYFYACRFSQLKSAALCRKGSPISHLIAAFMLCRCGRKAGTAR